MEMTPENVEHLASTLEAERELRDSMDRAKYGPDERLARKLAARSLRAGKGLLEIADQIEDFDPQLARDLREDA